MEPERTFDNLLARATELERLATFHVEVAAKLRQESDRLMREVEDLLRDERSCGGPSRASA
jgi:hypothetical protein